MTYPRRQFLNLSLAAMMTPLVAAPAGAAYVATPYQTGLLRQLRAENRVMVLNFTATWSLTCRQKRAILTELKAENPGYADALTFVDIDWDTFGPSNLADRLRIKRRSTLVAMRGREEIARVVAETDRAALRAFLDTALTAAG